MSIAPEHLRVRPRPLRQGPAQPSGLTVRHYLDLGRTESMMCRRPCR